MDRAELIQRVKDGETPEYLLFWGHRQKRDAIVDASCLHKFAAHAKLREFLLGTGERVLVEASPYDRIWGIGLGRDADGAKDPERWRGDNLLGFALMEVRERLRG
jgi:hypothetical protein